MFGLNKGKFLIGAWVAPTHEILTGEVRNCHINDYSYRMISELGLNYIYSTFETNPICKEDVIKSLSLAEKYGVKYIVKDAYVESKTDERDDIFVNIKDFEKYSSFSGLFMADEPRKDQFELLAKRNRLIKERYPDKVAYCNLFPVYAFPDNLRSENGCYRWKTEEEMIKENVYSYRRYVKDYLDIVKPEFLSYDYYPLTMAFPNLSECYFDNLDFISRISKEYNIPFCDFISVTSWDENHRLSIESEIFFQVTTSICYGTKGIQYFTFDVPCNGKETYSGEYFETAILDKNGKPTERAFAVKRVNDHIRAIENYLTESTHKGVYVVGETPANCIIPEWLDGKEQRIAINGKHILVGVFEDSEHDYYYIVNNSIEETDEITIKCNNGAKLVLDRTEMNFYAPKATICLRAGEAVLFILSK